MRKRGRNGAGSLFLLEWLARGREGTGGTGHRLWNITGIKQGSASHSHAPAVVCNCIELLAMLTGTLALSVIDFLGKRDQNKCYTWCPVFSEGSK